VKGLAAEAILSGFRRNLVAERSSEIIAAQRLHPSDKAWFHSSSVAARFPSPCELFHTLKSFNGDHASLMDWTEEAL
jgi:hypothetical protein